MIEIRDLGNDRGYGLYATQAIPSDTVLLSELPSIQWERGTYCPLRVLQSATLKQLDAIAGLSPDKLDSIPLAQREQALASLPAQEKPLLRHFFILETNSFPTGVYPAIARCNHSCEPNAFVVELEEDVRLELRTRSNVQAGEEILISYLAYPERMRTRERLRTLASQYLFECQCAKCQLAPDEHVPCPQCTRGQLHVDTGMCSTDVCEGLLSRPKQLRKLQDTHEKQLARVQKSAALAISS